MRWRGRGPRRMTRKKSLQIKLFFFLLLVLLGILLLDFKIRPIVEMVAEYQAKVFSTMMINNAILQELTEENLEYDNLIEIATDDSGQITAMHADITKLNRLKANLTNVILQQVQGLENQELSINIGTLSGIQYFIGRGPALPFRIVPVGAVETRICDKFSAAGINQTQHQILLEVEISILAILPGRSVTTTVHSNVVLAESILVGTVPESFAQIDLGGASEIDVEE